MSVAHGIRELAGDLAEVFARARNTWTSFAAINATEQQLDGQVDAVATAALLDLGYGVWSEESGCSTSIGGCRFAGALEVVLDPVDGSRNYTLGIPWIGFSACVLLHDIPLIGAVGNLCSGQLWWGGPGLGAWSWIGETPARPRYVTLAEARLVVSGCPPTRVKCGAFRDLGAMSLDVASVAMGTFDVFADCDPSGAQPWDHLATTTLALGAGRHVQTLRRQRGPFGRASMGRAQVVVAMTAELATQAAQAIDQGIGE